MSPIDDEPRPILPPQATTRASFPENGVVELPKPRLLPDVGLPGILAARGKPIEEMSLEELGIKIEPRVELVGLQQVSSQRTGRRLENVTELLECLRENTELF